VLTSDILEGLDSVFREMECYSMLGGASLGIGTVHVDGPDGERHQTRCLKK